MYVYRYVNADNDTVEGYSDDGEVRGSKEIWRAMDRLGINNVFVAVSRRHDGPNIGQRRFDIIREVTNKVINLMLTE